MKYFLSYGYALGLKEKFKKTYRETCLWNRLDFVMCYTYIIEKEKMNERRM